MDFKLSVTENHNGFDTDGGGKTRATLRLNAGYIGEISKNDLVTAIVSANLTTYVSHNWRLAYGDAERISSPIRRLDAESNDCLPTQFNLVFACEEEICDGCFEEGDKLVVRFQSHAAAVDERYVFVRNKEADWIQEDISA